MDRRNSQHPERLLRKKKYFFLIGFGQAYQDILDFIKLIRWDIT